jgi:chitin synthase
LASTILGPGTILLTVASSFRTVFTTLTLAESYTLAVAPAIFYLVICLKCKANTQVFIGALMSSIYSMIMTMVLVATIAQLTNSDEISASSFFFVFLIILFFLTGVLHPQEIMNLLYGLLYLVTLPGGYVLLVIYSICNLHVVSWGTREVAVKKSKKKRLEEAQEEKKQAEQEEEQKKNQKQKKSIFTYFLGSGDDDKGAVQNLFGKMFKPSSSHRQEQLLLNICSKLENLDKKPVVINGTGDQDQQQANDAAQNTILDINGNRTIVNDPTLASEYDSSTVVDVARNDLYNPYWIDLKWLGKNEVYYLNTKEMTFWQGLLEKYLHPIDKDVADEARITRDLKELRNNSCFAFFMLNALWVVMQFQFEYVSMAFPRMQIPVGILYNQPDHKVQILGIIFLILFTTVLILQFVSMLFHRWGTIVEILASTRLFSKHHKYRDTKLTIQEAVDLIKEMELERQGSIDFDATSMGTPSANSLEDSSSIDTDNDNKINEEDILPEPEPDYFEHPAVNNAQNWNHNHNQSIQSSEFGNGRHNPFNHSQIFTGKDGITSPFPSKRQQNFRMNGGFQPMNTSMSYSPHQSSLKPLQSLDTRVIKRFRAMERNNPDFKRRLRQIQTNRGSKAALIESEEFEV